MMDFLPELGGIAFGSILAVVLEFAKLIGITEDYAPVITVVCGGLWAAAVIAAGFWPEAGSWVIAVLQVVLTIAGVIFGAKGMYVAAVKPINRKRWNRVKS